MTDREMILAHLKRLLERYPEERFGQIFENATFRHKDLFYTSDADVEKTLRTYLADSYIQ